MRFKLAEEVKENGGMKRMHRRPPKIAQGLSGRLEMVVSLGMLSGMHDIFIYMFNFKRPLTIRIRDSAIVGAHACKGVPDLHYGLASI